VHLFSACRATLNGDDDEEVGVVQFSYTADQCVCCLLMQLFLSTSFFCSKNIKSYGSFIDLSNSFGSVRSSC
jgi:hypothetical protein